MIKWGSTLKEYPKLEFARPIITATMKAQAEKNIPMPAHCTPWLAAQSAGLVIKWPHETTTLIFHPLINTSDKSVSIETLPAPRMEWHSSNSDLAGVGRFAPWHFSLLPQYVFRTPPGVGLYVVGLPDGYKSPLDQRLVVRGVLETDWYSLPPFFVYRIPYVYGETTVILETGDPLCMVVPVMLNSTAPEMSVAELTVQLNEADAYDTERTMRDDLLWYSQPSGQMFSHLYKEKSRRFHAGS